MNHILENQLLQKIDKKTAIVGIIGLGYVGGALAELIYKKGYRVVGFEKNQEKIRQVNKRNVSNFTATDNPALLSTCDIIIVCIQTPIKEDKTPDLSFLENAAHQINQYIQKGQLVTIESSINPGVTRHTVLPLLQNSRISEKDFFLSFSPERIDPGNTIFPLEKIPKIVSGINDASLHVIKNFYATIFPRVIPVSSLETAEMVKIFENTFRFINICLTNELKEYTNRIGIDMWEVIQAANTKPFGFLAHFPSPGIGGHCIPVDPFYLYFDAQKKGIDLSFIRLAGSINDKQPYAVVEQSLLILHMSREKIHANLHTKKSEMPIPDMPLSTPLYGYPQPLKQKKVGSKGGKSTTHQENEPSYNILLIGVAYKPGIDDIRESPAIKIWDLFKKLGHNVSYHDPFVQTFQESSSVPLSKETLLSFDMYVIVTNHTNIDYTYLASFGKPIIDTRHAYEDTIPNVYYV